MYLNREDFIAGIPPQALKSLTEEMIVFDVDAIAEKIMSQYKRIKLINNAILNATKVNSCNMTGERGKQLLKESKRMGRLEPWLR
jgi:hypothetical protein